MAFRWCQPDLSLPASFAVRVNWLASALHHCASLRDVVILSPLRSYTFYADLQQFPGRRCMDIWVLEQLLTFLPVRVQSVRLTLSFTRPAYKRRSTAIRHINWKEIFAYFSCDMPALQLFRCTITGDNILGTTARPWTSTMLTAISGDTYKFRATTGTSH